MTNYPEWRKRACQWCAAGLGMSGYKNHHWTGNPDPPTCTAPTDDEYIAQLEARVAELEAVKPCRIVFAGREPGQ